MHIFSEYFDIFCTEYVLWIEKWKKPTPALNRIHNLVRDPVIETQVSLCTILQQHRILGITRTLLRRSEKVSLGKLSMYGRSFNH